MTTNLQHPRLLQLLARAGHGAQILLADAHFPVSTTLGPNAEVVHLNLTPGVIDAVTVLDAVLGAVAVEAVSVMQPQREGPHAMSGEPPIWTRFRASLARAGFTEPFETIERFAFYAAARDPDTAVVIATGEVEVYANLILRVGVVRLPVRPVVASSGGTDGTD